MPEDEPREKPEPVTPLDYQRRSSNGPPIGRILVIAIWLIISGVLIWYLIRMFRTP